MNAASHRRPVFEPSASAVSRNDPQHLSDLISVIYDAAIDQSFWETAIERVTHFVGGAGAGLYCKDVDAQYGVTAHSFGIVRPIPVELFRQMYPVSGEALSCGD